MIATLVRHLIAAGLIFGLAGGIAACNTVDGFGKDISAAGRAMGADSKKN
ncbi:MAG: entericidin A/B family lipoprotein [Alphaproteobacteria bacterium]